MEYKGGVYSCRSTNYNRSNWNCFSSYIAKCQTKYKKNEATAKIKKFISVINQALIRAELDYGNREDWIKGEMNNYDSSIEFLNTYIKPYITNSKIEKGGALSLQKGLQHLNFQMVLK